ncbi:hypothetical protein [Candidatus Chromulinivorax destructor]|uniref:Uncharacterized protein n=1 Tax=Candidatus Chromulinivorax destructor TaxID=2066483 RepID=A0A345ZC78_9BACT|nr:hypothetical protein [Candidatus Chromulinivorax destructor]AXK60895.1 hypothetical protein C0J27_04075 [Candidatus Chromulinivorax destructor]
MKNFKIAVCIALTLGLHQQINSLPDVDVKSKEVGVKEVNKPGSKQQEPSAEEKNLINQDSLKNKDNSSKNGIKKTQTQEANPAQSGINLGQDSQASSPIDTTATKKTGLAGKMNYVYKRGKEGMQAVSKTASNAVSTVSNAFSFAKPEADNTSSQATSISASEATKTTSNLFPSSETTGAIKGKDADSTTVSNQQDSTTAPDSNPIDNFVGQTLDMLNIPKDSLNGEIEANNYDPSNIKKYKSDGPIMTKSVLKDGSEVRIYFDKNNKPISTNITNPANPRANSDIQYNSDGTITVKSKDGSNKIFKDAEQFKQKFKQKFLTDSEEQSLSISRSAAKDKGILDANDNIINTFKKPGSIVIDQSKPERGDFKNSNQIITDLSDGTRLITTYDSNGKAAFTTKYDMNKQKAISLISYKPSQNVAIEEVLGKNGMTTSTNTISLD